MGLESIILIGGGALVILGVIVLSNKYRRKVDLILFQQEIIAKSPSATREFQERLMNLEKKKKGLLHLAAMMVVIKHAHKCLPKKKRNRKAEYDNSILTPKQKREYIFVKQERKWIRLDFTDVVAVTSSRQKRNYMTIHTEKKLYEVRGTLKEFKDYLPDDLFIMIHKSEIINLEKVVSIDGDLNYVKLKNISLSQSVGPNYRPLLQEKLRDNSFR